MGKDNISAYNELKKIELEKQKEKILEGLEKVLIELNGKEMDRDREVSKPIR